MNKKFMVVALMVALSATGYGALNMPKEVVDPTYVENGETKLAQHIVQSNVSNINQNFKDVFIEVANKVNADEVYNKVEADNKFASKDELNSAIDRINSDLGQNLVDTDNKINDVYNELNGKIDEKADQSVVDDLASKVDGKVDQDKFDNLDNEVGKIFAEVGAIKGNIEQNNEDIENIKTENNTQNGRLDKVEDKNNIQDGRLDKVEDKNNIQDGRLDKVENANNIQNGRLDNHEARITHLEDRVDRLDDKMNEGLSLMAAMNAVDFQNVQAGEMAIGAGFGHYGNAQSVAVGVAYAPTDNFNVNVKYSATAGNPESFAIGAGASYKFKVGR